MHSFLNAAALRTYPEQSKNNAGPPPYDPSVNPLRLSRFLLGAMLLSAPILAQETAEAILARAVRAAGGRERLAEIRTLRLTGVLFVRGVSQGPLVIELKDHERIRAELGSPRGDKIALFDGSNAWQIGPGFGGDGLAPMPAALARDITFALDVAGPIVDWQKRGWSPRLAGREPVDGRDAVKVDFVLPGGAVRTLLLDAETGRRLRWEAETGVGSRSVRLGLTMSDYETIDGIAFPFCLQAGQARERPRLVVEWTRVEINPDLDDALFLVSP